MNFFYSVLRRKADSKVRYLTDVVQQLERILDIIKKNDDAVLFQDLRQIITGLDNQLILICQGIFEFT